MFRQMVWVKWYPHDWIQCFLAEIETVDGEYVLFLSTHSGFKVLSDGRIVSGTKK